MNKKYVLFDFDGVILDSYKLALETRLIICPHVTDTEYRKRFEGNINDHQDPAHTKECRLDINFADLYAPKMQHLDVVPGMPEVIKKLADEYTLIVISSTNTNPIDDLLVKNNLRQYFAEIMGNDVHKSKVEKIKMVFDKYKTNADSCVFVTDTLGDIYEASKMNVASIGVTWGFHTVDTLVKGNPFKIVEKPEGIVSVVEQYFSK